VVVEPAPPAPVAPPAAPKRFHFALPAAATASWQGPTTSLDMGVSMGRSFRGASFGPNGQLVVLSRDRKVHVHRPAPSSTAASLPLLAVHQAIAQTSSAHHKALPRDVSAHVHRYVAADPASGRTLMWKLVLALFGQEPNVSNGHVDADRRDVFVSRWFEEAVAASSASSSTTNGLKAVLQALCQRKLVVAAQRATQVGNFRLAMLLAQAQVYESSDVRLQLRAQLSQWEDQGTTRYMEKELTWIYSLLAGSVGVVTTQAAASMDWVQMLALVLWYHEGPTSLAKALDVYQSYVHKGWCKPALTRHMKLDVLMELLQLACGAKTSLASVLATVPDDIAWHLNALLASLPGQRLRLSVQASALVTRQYLSHLVSAGRIEDALYVALTLPTAVEREATARAILDRHVTTTTNLTALEALVPPEWIHHALALSSLSVADYGAAVGHWLRAKDWAAAHDLLVDCVVFPALFCNDTTDLRRVLDVLAPHADRAIPQWATYGRVVRAYLVLRDDKSHATLESVVGLCDQLKQWQRHPRHSLHRPRGHREMEVACLSNMLTYVTDIALRLLEPSISTTWLDRLEGNVRGDCFGEGFRATTLVRACAAFE
ncbi:hypothetical protein As57867_003419, partial [Aphanomyces stellatus]